MPLNDGDPAHEQDVWLRIISNERHLKTDGTIHNSAFGGKAFSLSDPKRPWKMELSGKLLSLIKHLENECKSFCGPKPFVGVVYQKVEKLRSDARGIRTDVFYTPITEPPPPDLTHSDFVTFDELNDEDMLQWFRRDRMQDLLQAVRADKLSVVEHLRTAAE